MSKAQRNREQHAREKIAAQQLAARRSETRRRVFIVGGSLVVVLAVVVAFIIVKSLSHTAPPKADPRKTNSTITAQITHVPASVLDSVGAGASTVDPLIKISSPPLRLNGKPEMLFIGAEYCPYCGAERWAMAVALSRFGTLSNLHFIRSTSNDIYSNTATLTFYKSSYVSKYLTFHPVEWYTVTSAVLQTPTKAELALLDKFGQGSYPFVDIDGKYVVSGTQYMPSVIGSLRQEDPTHFGLNWATIAKDLQSASNPVAQSILGAANHITAAICKVTNDQPSNVCTSAAVTAVGGNI
jgi:hypothetical protein